ncbi:hypothetical protein [Jannaschia sp. CCS1]|uniref:hypothetical protein n=1 Tax=Jannaschia sp. (strain CCS1) TaxID=290400 RepID=UPI0003028009|nr:hypothetical protein [Jannaschia sp. CCS1]
MTNVVTSNTPMHPCTDIKSIPRTRAVFASEVLATAADTAPPTRGISITAPRDQ